MVIKDFIDQEYKSHCETTLAASTADGYRKLWKGYARYFEDRELTLRVFEAQKILRQIALDNPHLTKSSLRHIKTFMGGVFSHAQRMGEVESNPWAGRAVAIPAAKEGNETYAYDPKEVDVMLTNLNGQAYLAVLLAACSGLRKSELRGLQLGDWDPGTKTLSVNRAVWRSVVKTTKSRASKAPVPVIDTLAAELDKVQNKCFILETPSGRPLDLDNLAREVIVPALRNSGVTWHGWHAFRRGLATFLHAQGIDDKTIQALLRHENISTTQKSYIKTIPASVRNAMAAVTFGGAK
jgi:integrase